MDEIMLADKIRESMRVSAACQDYVLSIMYAERKIADDVQPERMADNSLCPESLHFGLYL